ncbi:hypothetical protein EVB81_001 [Rhizobium phage RHph_I46]|uniref:Uncharacterized protein n=1 Tax=Rhizobium phage RHph_I1_9 TaxID=2509729 RepID=A0A7S5R9H9_9CAUD|nr:hypothetical protein PP936_gp001 [Rhizobium phage RHph_I1_9]QIG69570.1 hypothetical protein EVB81_001 [Rhizobium phage RHph_I46]QIG70851.1 hypothetical protein EVB92_001 [Rhizobium phage RHph_I9]QIG73438.1 hypothetical protein EVC04_001 [Rhizobium phage RHph_I1_9]QIG76190.1 hypothetical protein EVC25_001 [Rhizobium phage RHph_I34]
MSSFAMTADFRTGKREFEDYIISWVIGGRIKVENLKTKIVSFYDYSAHVLKSVIDLCERRKKEEDYLTVYFSIPALELIGTEYIEILQDETAFFLIPQNRKTPESVKLQIKDEGRNVRQIHLSPKNCSLKSSARYLLQSDGELIFFEDITPENFCKRYEEPVVNVYATTLRKK